MKRKAPAVGRVLLSIFTIDQVIICRNIEVITYSISNLVSNCYLSGSIYFAQLVLDIFPQSTLSD